MSASPALVGRGRWVPGTHWPPMNRFNDLPVQGNKHRVSQNEEDAYVAESACYSPNGLGLLASKLSGSQSPATPGPGNPTPSSDLRGHLHAHVRTHTRENKSCGE